MMTIFLILALGQSPATADLAFAAAVEGFVRTTPGAAPPAAFVGAIGRLGEDCYACRELATRQLTELSREDPRWLVWGLRSRDPEIRLRCHAILRRLNACPQCGGSGVGPERYRWDDRSRSGYYTTACAACDGIGST